MGNPSLQIFVGIGHCIMLIYRKVFFFHTACFCQTIRRPGPAKRRSERDQFLYCSFEASWCAHRPLYGYDVSKSCSILCGLSDCRVSKFGSAVVLPRHSHLDSFACRIILPGDGGKTGIWLNHWLKNLKRLILRIIPANIFTRGVSLQGFILERTRLWLRKSNHPESCGQKKR